MAGPDMMPGAKISGVEPCAALDALNVVTSVANRKLAVVREVIFME